MARAPRDDDDLPWLAEGVREAPATLVPRARLVGGSLLAVLVAVLVGLGVYLASGHKSDGSAGYARAEDAPLIAADPGPYKVSPTDPGGTQITGLDDATATVASGADTASTLAPDTGEEPLARPGPGPAPATAPPPAVIAPPTDLLPATIPPAAPPPRAIPVAPIVAPAPGPAARPAKPAAADVPAARPPALPKAAKADARPAKIPPHDDDALAAVGRSLDAPAKPDATPPKADSTPRPKPDMAAGRVALQLGAFSTRDKAETAWAKAGGDGALAGLAKHIEPIERDGATLYRLRAGGVASKDAAKALCARLTAAGNACIVAP